MNKEIEIGFRGLSFYASIDEATNGSLDYIVVDDPKNCDIHAEIIGLLMNSRLILSIENGKLKVNIKE